MSVTSVCKLKSVASGEFVTAQGILNMEERALQRWCQGDPSGFLEISAEDVVYFDPFQSCRIDGLNALTKFYESIRGKIRADRFDIPNASVQFVGDAAILTFNYTSFQGSEEPSRWNCTEVYRRQAETWRIIQTHWSFTNAQRPR